MRWRLPVLWAVLVGAGELGGCSFGADIRLGGAAPTTGGHSPADGGGVSLGGEAASQNETGGSASGGRSSGGTHVGGAVSSGGAIEASGGLGGAGPSFTVTVSNIRPLVEINAEQKDDNPTLTDDELLVCFTSKRPTETGGTDVWCSERSSTSEPFGEPREQSSLNTPGFESSPSLGADGLSIWIASDVDGDMDILVAFRSDRGSDWGPLQPVAELNSTADDLPRPLARGGRLMPLSSRRDHSQYWTYLAERPSLEEPFGEPRLIEELAEEGRSFVDGFLLEDGLTLFFTMVEEGGKGDLYVARRESLDAPFSEPEEVRGANTDSEERDPFVSADGMRLYFSSDRDGELDLFVADLEIVGG
ncbi:MAG: hypothetical protein B6A08_06145 [Sorangiineae bacterium NIC37A_2]|jgi:hypothetical protein|nr:MAG: hypothetical protein B6A08_06145 [Sorangiineae bacterium NIC37A_2]